LDPTNFILAALMGQFGYGTAIVINRTHEAPQLQAAPVEAQSIGMLTWQDGIGSQRSPCLLFL